MKIQNFYQYCHNRLDSKRGKFKSARFSKSLNSSWSKEKAAIDIRKGAFEVDQNGDKLGDINIEDEKRAFEEVRETKKIDPILEGVCYGGS